MRKIQKDRNIPLENRYIDYEFVDYKKFPYRGYVRAATLSAWDVKEKSVGVEDGLTMAYEMYLPFSNRMISACSSILLILAAAVAPPATPPMMRCFILCVFLFPMENISNAKIYPVSGCR